LVQVAEQDCPHLLFYGPPGSGKKTLIMALIKQMFGPGAEKVVFSVIHRFTEISVLFYFIVRGGLCWLTFFCVLMFHLQVKMENKTWKIDVSHGPSFFSLSPALLCSFLSWLPLQIAICH
jgi:DNA polymerase III delta prime subunit